MEVRQYSRAQENIESQPIRVFQQEKANTGLKRKLIPQENVVARTPKQKPLSITQTKVANARVSKKSKVKDGIDEVLKITQQPIQDDTEDVMDILKSLDPNAKAKEKAAKDVAFLFEPKLYDGEVDYAKDGNIIFYTQENEKKRAALKTNAMVKDAINSITNLLNFERDGTISKSEYIRLNTCIARILRQDLKEAAITKLVEEDWKHDSKGREVLTRKEVYDSLFELGDQWTPDIDSYQYVAFFDRISKLLRGREELNNKPKSKTSLGG